MPALVTVNGKTADYWGLSWLSLAPGSYVVAFSPVAGFQTPAPQTVTITTGQTTTIVGLFGQNGYVQAVTNPAVPAAISVDDVRRNEWGMWADFAPGSHTVCFDPVQGRTTPPCRVANVTAGTTTTVTGNY